MDHGASTRFAGRLSAFMYVLSAGTLLVAALVLPQAPGSNRAGLLALAGVALVVGAVIAVLPWARWPLWTTLILLFPTFVLIALNNYFGGSYGHRYAPLFFVTFAWIGLTQRRWTSVMFVPLAAVAYLVPLGVAGRWTR